MKSCFRRTTIVLAMSLAVLVPPLAVADMGGGSNWSANESADPDYANAVKAIEARNWGGAIELLTKSAARNDKNADVHNLLGYSERKRGNLDAAFRHYARALRLDPKHRGAHEYVGEAYLMVGNLAKAEEHLATLDKLCFLPCGEHKDLKAKIAEYKQKP